MNNDIKTNLERIMSKDISGLDEADVEYLRARRSYLTAEQQERYADVLASESEVEATEPTSKGRGSRSTGSKEKSAPSGKANAETDTESGQAEDQGSEATTGDEGSSEEDGQEPTEGEDVSGSEQAETGSSESEAEDQGESEVVGEEVDLMKLNRSQLEELAIELGVENPTEFANKNELRAAIEEKHKSLEE